jgi:hypothetical protein
MKILIILYLVGLILTMSVFVIEIYVDSTPKTNKFHKWWRKNVVGLAPGDLDF